MKQLLLVTTLFLSFFSFSQTPVITENTQISIITIGQGNLLNDAFGHNGFRVKNEYTDVIYDYGRYNFKDPNFYLNFAQGKLKYLMGKARSSDVIAFYESQDRTIKEQVLNINKAEKQKLWSYLINNNKPENQAYLYDFFYDNCATKIRDVLEENINGNITYSNPENYSQETFRTLIQNNLNRNSWGSLGIDLALGSIIDQKASPREYMFLPENIFNFYQLASFKKTNTPVVKQSKVLYQSKNKKETGSFLLRPFFVLSLIALLILWLTYRDYKNAKRNKTLDVSIHLITGITGVLLMLLWFATNHTATQNNYNLLWAFPIGIIAFLQALKAVPKRWYIGYLKLLIIMLCLMSLHWIIGVQRFAPTLLPVIIALFIRYVYLIRYYKQQETS
ncbi:DUF4105 domain-containing protein [Lacinutrix sp. 5H-3-7-4]|uniref:lipoprotein N-acyltransferase Lnb domain-containing protein n=1 Tax=Lacinutrix sp. (strain 5H-3-7-4) TaxID=983544 RepID=UPI00020A3788|nr:DUF4105 domain-containing protein [Lacinutrix sp. 5H-3-7-4]AEG99951.1 hypothetical protein Lacal_0099 [Lacinutrix sp. 5H-3-7-4]